MLSVSARALPSRRTSALAVTVLGTLLIASTYGMARFGVGLFAPRLGAERPDLAQVLGLAGAAQFASYSLAAAVAGRIADRRPRTGLLLAGTTASLGCLGVAVASTPGLLVAAVFIGGLGAGFASPAMVRVIDMAVPTRSTPIAHSLVNTGTAFGVAGVGALAFLVRSTGPAWLLMASVCAVSASVLLLVARRDGGRPASHGAVPDPVRSTSPASWHRLAAPAAAAVVAGAGSALIWTFGPSMVVQAGAISEGSIGWLWIALGVGGLAGPLTGAGVGRVGPGGAWWICAAVLGLANLALAAAILLHAPWAAFAAMTIFGAGYMCLSGVLIFWSRAVWPSAAAAGTAVLFIALAVGQALGALIFSLLRPETAPVLVAVAAALLCAIAGVVGRVGRPRPSRHSPSSRSESASSRRTASRVDQASASFASAEPATQSLHSTFQSVQPLRSSRPRGLSW